MNDTLENQSTSNQYMIEYITEQLQTATPTERAILEEKLKEFMSANETIKWEIEQEKNKKEEIINEEKELEAYKKQLSKYL